MSEIVLIRKDGSMLDLNSVDPYRCVKDIQRTPAFQQVDIAVMVVDSSEPIEFIREDHIIWLGRPWIYFSVVDTTEVVGENMLTYTVSLYSPDKYFEDTEFMETDANKHVIAGNEEPPFCGDLEYFAYELCENLERNNERRLLNVGRLPQGDKYKKYVYVEFTEYDCLSCLIQFCKAFDVSYTVSINPNPESDYLIDFWECDKQQENEPFPIYPVTLSYGQDNGLFRLSRKSISTKSIITILLVLGSDKNLLPTYGFPRLRLPIDQYPNSIISDPAKIAKFGRVEGRYNSDIHPTRLGTVDYVYPIDNPVKPKYSFRDDNMDFNPTGARVAMMSGLLAGFQLEVTEAVNISGKSWKITVAEFTNNNGQTVPNGSIQFAIGDTYHFIDFPMPISYQTTASELMAIDGLRQYDKVSQPQVDYDSEPDWLRIKEVGVPLEVGMLLHIKDEKVGIDKLLRILSFTQSARNVWQYTNVRISDITGDEPSTALYKTVVRSADKLKYAGLTDPSDSPVSALANLQNAISQKFGYKNYAALTAKFGANKSIIDPDIDIIRADLIDVNKLAANEIFVALLAVKDALVDNLNVNRLLVKRLLTDPLEAADGSKWRIRISNSENHIRLYKEVNGEPDYTTMLAIALSDEHLAQVNITQGGYQTALSARGLHISKMTGQASVQGLFSIAVDPNDGKVKFGYNGNDKWPSAGDVGSGKMYPGALGAVAIK